MKNKFLLSIIYLLLGFGLIAQTNPFATKSFVKKGVVLLRWAPPDKNLWDLAVKYGYKIDRIQWNSTIPPDTTAFRNSTLLTLSSLKAHPEKDTLYWKDQFRQNKNAALLYSLLYPRPPKKYVDPKQKAMSDQMTLGLVLISCDHSAEIAKAAGLFFADSTIKNEVVYAYRIRIDLPRNIKPVQAIIVVDARQLTHLALVDSLTGKYKNKKIALRWNVKNNKNDYSGYLVERGTDSLTFQPVLKTPFVLSSTQYEKEPDYADHTDTVSKLNINYYYRIRGLTHFGEPGPSGNIIKVKARVEIDGFPLIDSSNAINNKQGAVYWRMQKNFDFKSLKGFAISRAAKADGNYTFLTSEVLPTTTTKFIDEKAGSINYYKVCAISTGDDSAYSFSAMVQLDDTDPPQIPKGLAGYIDKKGKVHLSWNSNKEKDLRGYRIFRKNSSVERLVEATKKILTDTTFLDSVNTNNLEKNIYYTITALDRVYNNSKYAALVKLKRPDKIAPVPPLFKSAKFDKQGINLSWINSSSNDVSEYALTRKDSSRSIRTIREWIRTDTISFYRDTTTIEGNDYTYTLSVTDSSENVSSASSPTIHFEPGVRKKIKTINALANRASKKIELNWQYDKQGIQNFILYRSKKDEPLRIYKTLTSVNSSFTDSEIYISNVYVYALKAVFTNGAESEMSDLIEVNY